MIYSRIILVGKGGSGKDYARAELEKMGLKYSISHTSRPPRSGEENGKDYFFVTKEEAEEKIKSGNFFYEFVEFNSWIYGTSIDQFRNSDLLIMTPKGISQLTQEDRKSSFIIFLDIPEQIRRERISKRKDADSAERRLKSDNIDFENFTDFDHKITDPHFSINGEWFVIPKLKNFLDG